MTHTLKSFAGGIMLAAYWLAAMLALDIILYVYLEVPLK